MKNLVEKISAEFATFEKEAKAHVENGNKAAGKGRLYNIALWRTMF